MPFIQKVATVGGLKMFLLGKEIEFVANKDCLMKKKKKIVITSQVLGQNTIKIPVDNEGHYYMKLQ